MATGSMVGGDGLVFKVAGGLSRGWGGSSESGGAASDGGAVGGVAAGFGSPDKGLLWGVGGALWEFCEDGGGGDVGGDGNTLFDLFGQ